MFSFLHTVYILSVVADKSAWHPHVQTASQRAQRLLSKLTKQVLSARRIRHLLLSAAVHIHSPKTILDKQKEKNDTLRDTAQQHREKAGAEDLQNAPIKLNTADF